jgi:phage nucleotide-binding protein
MSIENARRRIVKIQSTERYGVGNLKFLIYGNPGAGKTSLALTIEEPTLVISAEGGLLPLRGKKIDYIDISSEDGIVLGRDARIKKLSEAFLFCQTDEAREKYKWLFLDSLTEIGQNVVEKLQKEFPERKDALVLWGEYSKEMRSLVKAFRDLPGYNVVFTALTKIEKDENGRRFNAIDLNGKIAEQLPAYFDEVFFYHTYEDDSGETKRVLVTKANDKAVAKDRSGKLDKFEQPNLATIASKIKGE